MSNGFSHLRLCLGPLYRRCSKHSSRESKPSLGSQNRPIEWKLTVCLLLVPCLFKTSPSASTVMSLYCDAQSITGQHYIHLCHTFTPVSCRPQSYHQFSCSVTLYRRLLQYTISAVLVYRSKYGNQTMQTSTVLSLQAGWHKSSENLETNSNFWRHKSDIQHVPRWGPTNIMLHRAKFSRRSPCLTLPSSPYPIYLLPTLPSD